MNDKKASEKSEGKWAKESIENNWASSQPSLPKRLFTLFAWACVLGAIYFIVRNWPGNDQFAIMFEGGRWKAFFWFAGLIFTAQLLRGFRWALLLSSQKHFNWRSVVPIHGWYFLVLAFSPMRGGDLGRIIWAKSQGVSGSWATGTVISERLFDVLILFSLLSVMLMMSPAVSPTLVNAAHIWLAIVILIYLALTFWAAKGADYFESRFGETATTWPSFTSSLFFRIIRLLHGLAVIKTIRTNLVGMAMSIAIWFLVTYGYYLFLNTLMPEVTYASAVAAVAFIAFSTLIGVAPGNVGIYEMAALLALKSFGIEPPNVLAAAIWLHLASILTFIIYGFSCRLILYRLGMKTI